MRNTNSTGNAVPALLFHVEPAIPASIRGPGIETGTPTAGGRPYRQAPHPCRKVFHVERRRHYLPMQKREKIAPSRSSEVTSPVMRPNERCPNLSSSAINSKAWEV